MFAQIILRAAMVLGMLLIAAVMIDLFFRGIPGHNGGAFF